MKQFIPSISFGLGTAIQQNPTYTIQYTWKSNGNCFWQKQTSASQQAHKVLVAPTIYVFYFQNLYTIRSARVLHNAIKSLSCLHWLGHSKWLMQQVVTSLECICWHCHCNLQLYCGSACLIAFTTLFTRSWSRVFFWSKLCYSCLHKIHFSNRKQTSSIGIGYDGFSEAIFATCVSTQINFIS